METNYLDNSSVIKAILQSPFEEKSKKLREYKFLSISVRIYNCRKICISNVYKQITKKQFRKTKTTQFQQAQLLYKNMLEKIDKLPGLWCDINIFMTLVGAFFLQEWLKFINNVIDRNVGYIYLFEDSETNNEQIYCKLGRTTNFSNRYNSDYSRNHVNMKLVRLYETYNIIESEKIVKKLKTKYIGKFDRNKKSTEFFTISAKDKHILEKYEDCLDFIFSATKVDNDIDESKLKDEIYIKKLEKIQKEIVDRSIQLLK